MIQNRELTMDDYLAMLRRRAKVILIPALVATLLGYLSYLVVNHYFAKFTSQSTILVEAQNVPDTMVQPVATEDLVARINTLVPQATSPSALKPALQGIPRKSSQSIDDVVDGITSGQTFTVETVTIEPSQGGGKRKPGQGNAEPAFKLSYTASNASDAKEICNAVTSLVLEKNLTYMQDRATGTTSVLNKGITDAQRNLQELNGKLADFKREHPQQLPEDQENNLKVLTSLSQQLEAQTQALNRDQQDKAYTESVLAQQVAAWRSTQSSTNPQTLEKQLSDLQSQLLSLQARYTDDHPDVIKTKADISEVKKKLAEVNKASEDATDTSGGKGSAMEPPEIRQLRLQVHQLADSISARTLEQKRLQHDIATLHGSSLSPTLEGQYKQLAQDIQNAQKTYEGLLADKSKADLTVNMTNQSEGERMINLVPANLPDSPSFPNPWLFSGIGLGAGLALGFGLAMWLELRDQSIRTEADAEAALELPLLAAVPWVGVVVPENGNSKLKFWNRNKSSDEHKDAVGV